ncbi:hypothetical protein NDU88_002590 [Pleurodeles waltl]|uniref:Uncharacterized protein n=1 Tax=Pleurodeles waltl TaxID=8319 RepID=A0AAV7UXI5_PLEWA|nr:hypothetical protein NDU88_002590 [Pleurodeles waltl]
MEIPQTGRQAGGRLGVGCYGAETKERGSETLLTGRADLRPRSPPQRRLRKTPGLPVSGGRWDECLSWSHGWWCRVCRCPDPWPHGSYRRPQRLLLGPDQGLLWGCPRVRAP